MHVLRLHVDSVRRPIGETMARTTVTVTRVPAYGQGANLTGTTGDDTNDHDIAAEPIRLHCLVSNSGAGARTFSVPIEARDSTFGQAATKSQSVAAAAGGVEGMRVVILDHPALTVASTKRVHLDSADANFSDCTLYGFTWDKTPSP